MGELSRRDQFILKVLEFLAIREHGMAVFQSQNSAGSKMTWRSEKDILQAAVYLADSLLAEADKAPGSEPQKEQLYAVELTSCGTRKIPVIKALLSFFPGDLRWAKDFAYCAPSITEPLSHTDCLRLVRALEAVGAAARIVEVDQ